MASVWYSYENVLGLTKPPVGPDKVFSFTAEKRLSMSARDLRALRDYLETSGNLGEYWRHGDLEK